MITTGSVVRAPFHYLEDITTQKERYGVVISDEKYHTLFRSRRYVLAYISSVIHPKVRKGWEFAIKEGSEIFKFSGLKKTSVIKAHRIIVLQEEEIGEEIGQIPLTLVEQIREQAIKNMFALK